MGAVLSQCDEDSADHPMVYYSMQEATCKGAELLNHKGVPGYQKKFFFSITFNNTLKNMKYIQLDDT